MNKNKPLFFQKNLWLLIFLAFLLFFVRKVFLKGYLIGPFDFLVGFYHPFMDLKWDSAILQNAVRHYKNYLMSDVVTVVLPVKLFALQLIKKGQIPLWNPYLLNGTPLLANVQIALFYPLNALYFLFDNKIAFNIYIISQLLLAFVFMYLFLRSLVLDKFSSYFGALAYAFSAFFIVWLPWGTLGHAFLWLPLILFSINKFFETKKKKYALIFVLSLAFSFFAGHSQTNVVVYGITILYLMAKYTETKNVQAAFSLACLIFISILLVSIQLLPTAELYTQSAREILANESFYKDQTLFFSSYLMAVFPDFFGNPVTRNWWGKINYAESAIYFGTTSLYFVLYALLRRKKIKRHLFLFLLTLLIASVVFSTQNPISHVLFLLKLPLISSSSFARYSMIFIFSGSILASIGFYQFFKDFSQKKYQAIYFLNLIFIAFLSVFWALIFLKLLPGEYQNNIGIIKRNAILPSLILISLILVSYLPKIFSLIPGIKLDKFHVKIISLMIIVILSGELFRFANKYTPFSSDKFFFPNHALLDKLSEITNDGRYLYYLPANTSNYYQIRGVEGGEPLYNKQLGELASLGKRGKVYLQDRGAISFPDGPYKQRILDLFSVKYFVDKNDNFKNSWINQNGKDFDERFKEIWSSDEYKIYLNKYAVNRHKLFYSVEFLNDRKQILKRLISKSFDPLNSVIVEKDFPDKIKPAGVYTLHTLKDEAAQQIYEVTTTQPGLFLVTDTFYPGWQVFIDGQKKELLKANYAFRGVLVDKGKHQVRFIYRPTSIYAGAVLSSLGLVLLILYLLRRKE